MSKPGPKFIKEFKPLTLSPGFRDALARCQAPDPIPLTSNVSVYEEAKRIKERALNKRRK